MKQFHLLVVINFYSSMKSGNNGLTAEQKQQHDVISIWLNKLKIYTDMEFMQWFEKHL